MFIVISGLYFLYLSIHAKIIYILWDTKNHIEKNTKNTIIWPLPLFCDRNSLIQTHSVKSAFGRSGSSSGEKSLLIIYILFYYKDVQQTYSKFTDLYWLLVQCKNVSVNLGSFTDSRVASNILSALLHNESFKLIVFSQWSKNCNVFTVNYI